MPGKTFLNERIAIFAGHSGGHLFPAQAFAEKWRKQYPACFISLVTSRKAEALVTGMPEGLFSEIEYLPEFPSPAGVSLRTIQFLFQLARAFVLSSRYLARVHPDLSVGFGSYVSYPGLLLSQFRHIPTLIHEQNVVPGKATEWLARHVDCVAVTFDRTFAGRELKRREVVGLPLRSFLTRAASQSKTRSGASKKKTLLIVGGSQGSHRLNEILLDVFSLFSHEEKTQTAVIHITGRNDFEWVSERYRAIGLPAEVYPFFEAMQELYGRADMAITRAGANTLFELALFGIPAIVIPYPHAGAHQKENAGFFAAEGAIETEDESKVDGNWMLAKIRQLIENGAARGLLAEKISRISPPYAAGRLVRLAQELLGRETE